MNMEELEVLESIYMDDMKVTTDESSFPLSIHLQLHPATGDELDKRYVCMTLNLNLPEQYPDEVPEIVITNPRGMADEEVQSLLQALEDLAEERKGSDMLYELIEVAKDSLTEGNIPYCACTICYEHFTDDDLFTKTDCYHYFHKSCLQRYIKHMKEVIEQEEASKVKHSQTDQEQNQIKCPVCREEIAYEPDFLAADFTCKGDNLNLQFKPTDQMQQWQKDMKELFQRQKEKGGIIDVEAEKNRFLLTESDIDVPVIVIKTEEDVAADKSSNESQGRQSPVIKFNQSGKGRGNSPRGSPQGHRYGSGSRGQRGYSDRPFSSKSDKEGKKSPKNDEIRFHRNSGRQSPRDERPNDRPRFQRRDDNQSDIDKKDNESKEKRPSSKRDERTDDEKSDKKALFERDWRKDFKGDDGRPFSRRGERKDFEEGSNKQRHYIDRGYNDRPSSVRHNYRDTWRGGNWRNNDRGYGDRTHVKPSDGEKGAIQKNSNLGQEEYETDNGKSAKKEKSSDSKESTHIEDDKFNYSDSSETQQRKIELNVNEVTSKMGSCAMARSGKESESKSVNEGNSRGNLRRGRGQRKHAGEDSRVGQSQGDLEESRPGQSRRHEYHHGNQGYYRNSDNRRSYGYRYRGQGDYYRKDYHYHSNSKNERSKGESGHGGRTSNPNITKSDENSNKGKATYSKNEICDIKADGGDRNRNSNKGDHDSISKPHLSKDKLHEAGNPSEINDGKKIYNNRDKRVKSSRVENNMSDKPKDVTKLSSDRSDLKPVSRPPGFDVKGPPPGFTEKSVKPPPGF